MNNIQEIAPKTYQHGLTKAELLKIFGRLRPVLDSVRNRIPMEKAA